MARLESRLALIDRCGVREGDFAGDQALEGDLEELETEVSAVALDALLDRISAIRSERFGGIEEVEDGELEKPRGRFLLYRLGRSLATGEAEIASRGFFDVWDRPPLSLWLEVVTSPRSGRSGSFDGLILAFVPEDVLERAESGRIACSNGSLVFLDERPSDLMRQLDPLVARTRTR